ncbi:MAG TPA: DUF4268 domain-containing protein [Pseudonocardiaceae bacterium]|nr:DUF4268 domain-containing protein [Pseudonocardiaceae bacterium]
MTTDAFGLGRLEYVDNIRTIWKHEAINFTPWLAENIDVLGQELGLQLTVQGHEVPVGDFRLDIQATDEHGRVVLIENQIEASDHSHLGQLIVYASGIGASVIVWVAARVREDHRSALEWLNSNTPPNVSFFAVEVGVVKIGSSPPAPALKVVAEPNDWRKAVRASSGTISTLTQQRMAFFERVFDDLAVSYPVIHRPSVQPENWSSFAAGPFGNYSLTFSKIGLRVEIYLSVGTAELTSRLYEKLLSSKTSIEASLGFPLKWELLDGKQASRLAIYRDDVNFDDQESVAEAVAWSARRVKALHHSLDHDLRTLAAQIKAQPAAGGGSA